MPFRGQNALARNAFVATYSWGLALWRLKGQPLRIPYASTERLFPKMNRFIDGQKELPRTSVKHLFVCSPLKRSIFGPFRVGECSGANWEFTPLSAKYEG